MAHFPVNHPLQPFYRALAGLVGIYVLAFGITALVRARSLPWFAQDGLPSALGLRSNRGFAVLSIAAGLVLLVGAIIGGVLDRWINLVAGVVFLVAGMAMMILMQTSLDFLGFTMTTCVVSFVIGLVLGLAGLYGDVGTAEDVEREERYRHGGGEPQRHPLQPSSPS